MSFLRNIPATRREDRAFGHLRRRTPVLSPQQAILEGGLVIVVLFSGIDRPDVDVEEQGRTSARMQEIVASIPGFISYN